MSLSTPSTVRNLQAALHAKAKGSPTFRFYSLYDKLSRSDILAHAYAASKANGKQRPLGIPTIRDRVAQMACVLVLDPIFEADMPSEQNAYRVGRPVIPSMSVAASAGMDRTLGSDPGMLVAGSHVPSSAVEGHRNGMGRPLRCLFC